MENTRTMHTTIGELIVALSDAVSESLPDSERSSLLVAELLNDLLANRRRTGMQARGFKAETRKVLARRH